MFKPNKFKKCVECKRDDVAPRYAANNLCEECWREMLKEKMKED